MKIQKILVPVDFSAQTDRAVAYANAYAVAFGASVTFFHAQEFPFHLFAPYEGSGVQMVHYQEQLRQEAEKRLQRLTDAINDVPASYLIVEGHPRDAIRHQAEDEKFDLIVLSTHGRTGLSRMTIGSVAEGVVRTAPCPVLTVRAPLEPDALALDEHLRRVPRVSRILFPTDLSDPSLDCLEVASSWAESFRAELDIVHVMEDLGTYPLATWEHLPDLTPDELYEGLATRSRHRLENLVKERLPEANWINVDVERGTPAQALLDRIQEQPYDLVVIPTHGRTGFRRAFIGSVAEKVVRHSECPVLTIRWHEQKGRSGS